MNKIVIKMNYLNQRIEQIEKFEVFHVRTLGDLVYMLQLITESIIMLENNHNDVSLLKIMLDDIINYSLEANNNGFSEHEKIVKIDLQRKILCKYLKEYTK